MNDDGTTRGRMWSVAAGWGRCPGWVRGVVQTSEPDGVVELSLCENLRGIYCVQ